jgi:hypothetical protein
MSVSRRVPLSRPTLLLEKRQLMHPHLITDLFPEAPEVSCFEVGLSQQSVNLWRLYVREGFRWENTRTHDTLKKLISL